MNKYRIVAHGESFVAREEARARSWWLVVDGGIEVRVVWPVYCRLNIALLCSSSHPHHPTKMNGKWCCWCAELLGAHWLPARPL